MKFYPKKKWGQNFLIDDNIARKIVKILGDTSKSNVIEIGPGNGALTNLINSKNIIGFEIDPILCRNLKDNQIKNFTCINQDILEVNLENYKFDKVIGNLPYYISSQIIFKLLKNNLWDIAIFMVQKELADRITASEGSRQYGRISVMIQACCDVKKEFNVSPNCFFPKPRITSSILTFKNKKIQNFNFDILEKVVKKCFGQRRKKIKNTLEEITNHIELNEFFENRPEMLSSDEFIKISNIVEFNE